MDRRNWSTRFRWFRRVSSDGSIRKNVRAARKNLGAGRLSPSLFPRETR